MINNYRVIAVIPARGGSKAVPYKNLEILGDKPLLAWPIETARKTNEIDRIIVSTDDKKISNVAKEYKAEVYSRPSELATDTSQVADTLRHLWKTLITQGEKADIFLLLEATSPFRTPELISKCLNRLVDEKLDSIATFHDADINPERVWRINDGVPSPIFDGENLWKPRQQLTPAYQMNGAVYAFFPERLPKKIPNILFGNMGSEIISSESVIDIDTTKDFKIANALLKY